MLRTSVPLIGALGGTEESKSHMSPKNPTPREFAAIAYALGVTRGILSSLEAQIVNDPEFLDEIRLILQGTSSANIAKTLGLQERDLAIDWSEYLTNVQKDSIRGSKGPE